MTRPHRSTRDRRRNATAPAAPTIAAPAAWTRAAILLALTIAAPAFAGVSATAQETSPEADAAAAPKAPAPMAVVPEPVADLGLVTKGDTATHEFVIRNDGDAPLEVTEVRPGCGCTVAQFDRLIPPGGSGKIVAKLDTTSLSGGIAKPLSVFTNDPANPRINLTLRVRVDERLIFNPGFARFVRGHGQGPGTVSQILYSPDFAELEVLEAKSPLPFLEVEYRPATEEEERQAGVGKQWVFNLTLNYEKAPVGALIGDVAVVTNHPVQKVVNLPISGFVRPRLAVTPTDADFGEIEIDDEPKTARFMVQSFVTDPVEVTGVDGDLEGIELTVEEIEAGKRYSVEVTFGPKTPKGYFEARLRIHTSDEVVPIMVVPIKGTVL